MSAPLSVTQLKELLMWGHWDAAQACWVTWGPWANSDLNSIQGTCVRREDQADTDGTSAVNDGKQKNGQI